MKLLLLPATLLLSIGTINHQSFDAFGRELQVSSTEPKNCSISLDYISKYPPYFQLYITNIFSADDNLFPDNTLIAIKADKGRLLGGQSVTGWHVYSTTDASITEKIKYIPPNCEISNNDILSFAAVYETDEGTLDIGSVNFTKKIINPICLGAGPLSDPKDTFGPEDPEDPEDPGDIPDKPGITEWTGTINLEIIQTYNCDVDEQVSELSHQRTIAGDHKRTVASITIGMTDFDLPKQGTNAEGKLQYRSGQVTYNMREDHTTEGNAEKTQCHNDGTGKWEWVSPGSWGTTHQTMTGQAYCDIKDGGLTILIVKETLGEKEMKQEMAKLQAKMQEAAAPAESGAIETYKAEMLKLIRGDQGSSSIPIKVAINIFTGSIYYPVYTTYERKAFDVCSGDFDENESRSETIEMPLALPLGAEMKGLYTRDDKGNDRIEASINDSQPYHVLFGSDTCPEGTMTITGNITLERHKE